MKTPKVIAMELPNGSRIEIEHTAGKYTEKDGEWESININLTKAVGFTHTLAAIDYDGEFGQLALKVFTDDPDENFTVYEKALEY